MTCPRFLALAALLMTIPAFAALAAGSSPTPAANPAPGTLATDLGRGNGPVNIDATQGIELHQAEKAYVAHGDVVVTRGDRTLKGDTITAYYRETGNAAAKPSSAPQPGQASNGPATPMLAPDSGQTEIWRIVADGHVTLATPTQTVVGDHGVYDLDTKTAIITGKALRLTTPKDIVTARDALEWYDDKQLAVARGNALAIRADRRMRADILTAQVVTPSGAPARISRLDGNGHVVASAPDEIGTGDKGVYNVDSGIVTLIGHVTLTRGDNSLAGDRGVMDLRQGVSRLLPREPSGDDDTRGRVQAFIVPRGNSTGKPEKDEMAGSKDTPPASATTTPTVSQKP